MFFSPPLFPPFVAIAFPFVLTWNIVCISQNDGNSTTVLCSILFVSFPLFFLFYPPEVNLRACIRHLNGFLCFVSISFLFVQRQRGKKTSATKEIKNTSIMRVQSFVISPCVVEFWLVVFLLLMQFEIKLWLLWDRYRLKRLWTILQLFFFSNTVTKAILCHFGLKLLKFKSSSCKMNTVTWICYFRHRNICDKFFLSHYGL